MIKEGNTKKIFTRFGFSFVIVNVCIASIYINATGHNVSTVLGLYLTVSFLAFPAKFIALVRALNELVYINKRYCLH